MKQNTNTRFALKFLLIFLINEFVFKGYSGIVFLEYLLPFEIISVALI